MELDTEGRVLKGLVLGSDLLSGTGDSGWLLPVREEMETLG